MGRKGGGFTFHATRAAAATNLRAGGLEEADAMKITGHRTRDVFRRYDLNDVASLRERLQDARARANPEDPVHLHTSCTPGTLR